MFAMTGFAAAQHTHSAGWQKRSSASFAFLLAGKCTKGKADNVKRVSATDYLQKQWQQQSSKHFQKASIGPRYPRMRGRDAEGKTPFTLPTLELATQEIDGRVPRKALVVWR